MAGSWTAKDGNGNLEHVALVKPDLENLLQHTSTYLNCNWCETHGRQASIRLNSILVHLGSGHGG